MPIDKLQFVQPFLEEAEELLTRLEEHLLKLAHRTVDTEELNAIFRIAHSIKGNAATFGFDGLVGITHLMESLLDQMRHGHIFLDEEHRLALLKGHDALRNLVNGLRDHVNADQKLVLDAHQVLEFMLGKAQNAKEPKILPASDPNEKTVQSNGYEHLFHIVLNEKINADVQLALQRELIMKGALQNVESTEESTSLVLSTNDSKESIEAMCSFVVDSENVKISELNQHPFSTAISAKFAQENPSRHGLDGTAYGFFEPLQKTQASRQPSEFSVAGELNSETSTLRISTEKVENLINLVGELVITQSMIVQQSRNTDPVQYAKLHQSIQQLQANTQELQSSILSMRLMPMEYVFSRFTRLVHDLSLRLGKDISLQTEGGSTELDKGMIEKIIDPLTHLVRNSIDHGIEEPSERLIQGKPAKGYIKLVAKHQGNHIALEIHDDGAGLQRHKILNKAHELGIPLDDDIPDEELWPVIFQPGFSTAEQITDVSGRGVGMDVVRRNIQQLGGHIHIDSLASVGTHITITLPLTLAILEAMMVRLGSEIYMVPLSHIVETLKPLHQDILYVGGSDRLIRVRNQYLPLLHLAKTFGINEASTDPCDGVIMIVSTHNQSAAILVDELMDHQQIVVKNLQDHYKKVRHISGATLLGDGNVALILDVDSLLSTAFA